MACDLYNKTWSLSQLTFSGNDMSCVTVFTVIEIVWYLFESFLLCASVLNISIILIVLPI
jgi:hypothetical protein